MNAYKLADILHQSDFLAMDFAKDAATMLRQQADRIAELEKGLEDYSGEVDDGVKFVGTLPDGHPLKMSKPVAWWDGKHFADKHKSDLADIPLYAHPHKQLSDEEIDKLAEYHGIDSLYETGRIDFARAIIKEITE